jgi:inositol transporter-like SP family MFS transporter
MSNYIEAGSIIAIATSLGLWQARFGIGDLAVGLLAAFSANAFGAAIGAAIGGPLSDRYGRKFIYTYDLIVYMVGVLLAAFAVDFWMLLVAFVLTGIAVGAGVPASWTYIAEQAPATERAKHVGTAQLAWSMGPVLGFLLAVALGPLGLLGSRIIFLHLFVVAFVVWYIRQGLSESALWKQEKDQDFSGKGASAPRGGFRELLSRAVNVKALLVLFGVYGFWNLVAGQAGIFMPRVYETAGVESATEQNLLQVLVWSCTVASTYFGFMKFADRVNQRAFYLVGAVLGIVGWLFLVYGNGSLPVLLGYAVCWGLAAGIGAQAFYALWASELFATPYRASAQGVLFFAARIAVGGLSYWFPTLLADHGVPFVGTLCIGLLAVALLVGTIWTPQTRGKSLHQIEVERYGEPVSAQARAASDADEVTAQA